MNINDLKKEVDSKARLRNERLRRLYSLAKELGFTSIEAQILSHRSEGVIRQLSKEIKKNAG